MGNVYPTNGSQADVQAACSAGPDDGTTTVVIPNGPYSRAGNLTITNSLSLAGAAATGVTIQNNYATGDLINATSSKNGHINIYWLNFIDLANNGGGVGYTISADRIAGVPEWLLKIRCPTSLPSVGSSSTSTRSIED
jgi:hypothetical protein